MAKKKVVHWCEYEKDGLSPCGVLISGGMNQKLAYSTVDPDKMTCDDFRCLEAAGVWRRKKEAERKDRETNHRNALLGLMLSKFAEQDIALPTEAVIKVADYLYDNGARIVDGAVR